jgi:DSF synthase
MKVSVEGQRYTWPADIQKRASTDNLPPDAVWKNAAAVKLLNHLSKLDLFEIRLEFDLDLGAVWCFWRHRQGLSFAPRVLRDIRHVQRALQDFHYDEPSDAAKVAKFLIWASDVDGVFNLGGDLGYFETLIRQRDYVRLKAYALSCIDACYTNYHALHAPMIVGFLVAGDALGGGMEAALSGDFIIAEQHSKFGLPEMLYGLFPGMGAYSFLMRRLGQARAEALISRGNLHGATELQEMGLIERVVPRGSGREEMKRHLAKTLRRFNATLAIYNARRRAFPITFQEMADIVEEWVSVAMRLTDYDLRKMNKLVAAQGRLRGANVQRGEAADGRKLAKKALPARRSE